LRAAGAPMYSWPCAATPINSDGVPETPSCRDKPGDDSSVDHSNTVKPWRSKAGFAAGERMYFRNSAAIALLESFVSAAG
jgi:hypothetical protein